MVRCANVPLGGIVEGGKMGGGGETVGIGGGGVVDGGEGTGITVGGIVLGGVGDGGDGMTVGAGDNEGGTALVRRNKEFIPLRATDPVMKMIKTKRNKQPYGPFGVPCDGVLSVSPPSNCSPLRYSLQARIT